MADEMLLSSTRVIPKILLQSGYKFSDQSLDAVLHNCVEGK
jgi:NAD dependent epimerase/dehydratase family enzyme